ncbi:MAG: site-2 protease family protein [Elusimicrobia bacterium]|nr:site-2 protease family protein [Elusimicrobiota bacterium]
MEWIVQLPILFFSVVVHEVAHGAAALRNGDDTAQKAGRLTFNPLPHVDLLGSVFLPVFCLLSHLPLVGWAKPVPVNPSRLARGRWALWRVALVGPLANLGLGVAAALLYRVIAGLPAFFPQYQSTLLKALLFAVSLNVFLAFFNLIPVHPLDGSQVLGQVLPRGARRLYERHKPYGLAVLMILISAGAVKALVTFPSLLALQLLARLGLIW